MRVSQRQLSIHGEVEVRRQRFPTHVDESGSIGPAMATTEEKYSSWRPRIRISFTSHSCGMRFAEPCSHVYRFAAQQATVGCTDKRTKLCVAELARRIAVALSFVSQVMGQLTVNITESWAGESEDVPGQELATVPVQCRTVGT
jgi:hypothetical protein